MNGYSTYSCAKLRAVFQKISEKLKNLSDEVTSNKGKADFKI